MNKRTLKAIIVLISTALITFFGLYSRYQPDLKNINSVKVLEVHDGDTISVFLNGKREKIRLIGIDAPELDQKPWGNKARIHLLDLIKTSHWYVSLEYDLEKRDKHGRLLCYVWSSNREMLNLRMIKDGYAMLFTVPPNIRHVNEFRNAQLEARKKKIGIWSMKGLKESPSKYRREHPRF